MTRAPLAALAAALLCLGCASCGGASSATTTQAAAHDRDNDGDHNDDDAHVLDYGHAAYGAEKQAIVATLRAYYAVAAAENGAKACSMLDPVIVESVVENYGHSRELGGKTCAQVVTKMFVRDHTTLAGENATFKIYAVRVNGRIELTVLSFASLPEVRQLSVRNEDGSWKVLGLEDGIIE